MLTLKCFVYNNLLASLIIIIISAILFGVEPLILHRHPPHPPYPIHSICFFHEISRSLVSD